MELELLDFIEQHKNNKKYEFSFTGDAQTVILPPGIYSFECWGAAGREFNGNTHYKPCGKGAYVFGKLRVDYFYKFYIYVGEKGNFEKKSIFGGGGYSDYPGGGATDIRLQKASLDYDFASLKTRIIVAAGGGGADSLSAGGSGGGLKGIDSPGGSKGATQNSPGIGFVNGSFGYGGGNRNSLDNNGGGGGGYYGGGSGIIEGNYGGSGGSSFISGYEGCDAISAESTSTPTHTGRSGHYSGFIFYDGVMIDGDHLMPGITNTTEIGHDSSGYVRITLISNSFISLITYKMQINFIHFFRHAFILILFS